MKKTNIVLMLFVAASFLFTFTSCNRRVYRTVTIAIDCNCTPQEQLVAYEVINRRIASVWNVRERTELVDGKFTITYSDYNYDYLLTRMLAKRGEIYVTELFNPFRFNEEVARVHRKLSWFIENYRPLHHTRTHFALIAAPPQHVSYVDSVFNQHKDYFVNSILTNIYFAWTAAPNNAGFYELFALRAASRRFQPFSLNPNSVRACRLWEVEGVPQIDIDLNEGYHTTAWARLTRDNIGRYLAIVMDNKVLMTPRVSNEITSGKINITTPALKKDNMFIPALRRDDMFLIKSAILGGVLECIARIIEIPNTY